MREIKFRAWVNNSKHWIYLLVKNGSIRYQLHSPADEGSEISAWQQFTGLKDKNGKEIYEGDILKTHWATEDEAKSEIWEVKWNSEGGYFVPEGLADDFSPSLGTEELIHEVIGNIYENPELQSAHSAP